MFQRKIIDFIAFSQLSAIAIMTIPAEIYSFGWQYALLLPSLVFVTIVTNYVSLPVFYSNNIENCYVVSVLCTNLIHKYFWIFIRFQYLDMRFGSATRRILTTLYIFQSLFFIPLLMYIPSLAFAEGKCCCMWYYTFHFDPRNSTILHIQLQSLTFTLSMVLSAMFALFILCLAESKQSYGQM